MIFKTETCCHMKLHFSRNRKMDGHVAMSKVKHEDSMMCAYFSASIKVIVACAMSTKSRQHARRQLVAVRSKGAEKIKHDRQC
jgi:hypothetical protein